MSPVDLAIVALATLACLLGLYTGILRVLLASLGLGAAVWAAWTIGPGLAGLLARWLGSERAAAIAAYVVIMVTVVAITASLTLVITRSLRIFRLSWLDRTAGAALGLAAVAALAASAALALGVDAEGRRNLGGSKLLPALVALAAELRDRDEAPRPGARASAPPAAQARGRSPAP